MTQSRRVIIFRDHLFVPNETFIYAQAEALRSFEPCYAGSRSMNGLPVPPGRTVTTIIGDGPRGMAWEYYFKLFGTTPDLERRLRSLNPVLIHAHSAQNGLRVVPLARRLGIPLIVTFHGDDATVRDVGQWLYYGHRRYIRRRAELFASGARFIAVSEFIREKMIEQGCPKEKISLHYIGVNTSRFRAAPTSARENVVLFVGRLVPSKGADFLIGAMSSIQSRMPDARLIIIGDGPQRRALELQASKASINCEFLGMRPPEEVSAWMRRARVFCVPSTVLDTGQCEAFGIVFIEAQSCGLPVVSFATGGIPEAVVHGTTGLLAPDRDTATLAAHLQTLLTDDRRWKEFSEAGVVRTRREFDLLAQTAKLERIYEKVLAAA